MYCQRLYHKKLLLYYVGMFWYGAVGFMVGVAGYFLLSFGSNWVFLCCIVGAALSAYSLVERKGVSSGLALFCILFAIGVYVSQYNDLKYMSHVRTVAPFTETSVKIEGVVSNDIDIREKRDALSVSVTHIDKDGKGISVGGISARVYVPRMSEIQYGDHVIIEGRLVFPKPFKDDEGMEVPYQKIARTQGVVVEMFAEKIVSRVPQENISVFGTLYAVKHLYRSAVQRVLHEPYAGIANGIVIGEKHALSQKDVDAFTRAGLSHVTVLSGYNITLVITFFIGLLSFMYMRTRYVLAGIGAFLFVAMTGFAAPAVRSLLMALVVVFGKVTYNTLNPLRVLVMVCCAMVFWNPFILLDDVSFQLSALATAGLLLCQKPSEDFWKRYVPSSILDYISTTTAAMIGVMPLLLFTFKKVSVIALVANITVLPIVPYAMIFSFTAGMLGMCSATAAIPFALFARGILAVMRELVIFYASLSWSYISFPITIHVFVLMYLAIGTVLYVRYRNTF